MGKRCNCGMGSEHLENWHRQLKKVEKGLKILVSVEILFIQRSTVLGKEISVMRVFCNVQNFRLVIFCEEMLGSNVSIETLQSNFSRETFVQMAVVV